MPIYEYTCPKCRNVFEKWLKFSEITENAPCPQCASPAQRIISNTAFVLKGGGWYVTDYGYRKGASEDGQTATSDTAGSPASDAASDTAGSPASAAAGDSGQGASSAPGASAPSQPA